MKTFWLQVIFWPSIVLSHHFSSGSIFLDGGAGHSNQDYTAVGRLLDYKAQPSIDYWIIKHSRP